MLAELTSAATVQAAALPSLSALPGRAPDGTAARAVRETPTAPVGRRCRPAGPCCRHTGGDHAGRRPARRPRRPPMARSASDVLDTAVRELTPAPGANPLVPAIAAGEAPREVFATLALEQHHVITSDRRSFRHLAGRAAAEPPVAAFFTHLADGERIVLEHVRTLATACGLKEQETAGYEPRPGCQAYPAYAAWLALGAEPADAVLAFAANFRAWGDYCRAVGQAMRHRYGFTDEACAFFDFFATPAPDLTDRALTALRHGLDSGALDIPLAHRYGRLLQAYEEMFWRTAAEA
ncbi:transcriptional regulator [Streptomyces sclerotialus]|uniref:transcriptional regulator n=1 Tax=Streptomyces sclerotialus TaxID=1957 RepID=UPI0034A27DBA